MQGNMVKVGLISNHVALESHIIDASGCFNKKY